MASLLLSIEQYFHMAIIIINEFFALDNIDALDVYREEIISFRTGVERCSKTTEEAREE